MNLEAQLTEAAEEIETMSADEIGRVLHLILPGVQHDRAGTNTVLLFELLRQSLIARENSS